MTADPEAFRFVGCETGETFTSFRTYELLHDSDDAERQGLAMVYNPLPEPVRRTLKLPLYYTGLTDTAKIREKEGKTKKFTLDREFNVSLTVSIPANGYTWFVIE